jgi:DNA-binding transcriptional LysR family regulator
MSIDLNYVGVFYHVYRCRGFHAASRAMHLSQPTISEHIAKIEDQLGQPLFRRQPFGPLPLADFLYKTIAAPAVENLLEFERRVQAQSGPLLRIGASEFITQHYLTPLLTTIQRAHPGLRVTIECGRRSEIDRWLAEGLIDGAIAAVDQPPVGLAWEALLTLPVVLLVPASRSLTQADTLWAVQPVREKLICPPVGEGAFRRFDDWLRRQGVHWPISTIAGATAIVPWMVAAGLGVGVCVGISRLLAPAGIQALPLDGIEPVTVGAFWRGEASPELQAFLRLIGQSARTLTAGPDAIPAAPNPAKLTPALRTPATPSQTKRPPRKR